MPLSNELFRESALEQLTSPEQLDRLLQITSPKGWVSLAAIWLLLGTVIAWSFLGTIRHREEGHGIIVPGGGLKLVEATGAGRLSLADVGVGDRIEVGQVVARIEKQDLEDQLREVRSQLEEMQRQHEAHKGFDDREAELQRHLAEVEKDQLQQTIEFSRRLAERLQRRRETVQDLVTRGAMTDIDVDEVDEEIEKARDAIVQAELQIQQLEAQASTESFAREREQMKRQLAIEELGGKATVLESLLERESHVRSTVTGRIVEVRVADHSVVSIGDPVLVVEPVEAQSGELEAVVYVSAATAKGRVKDGMRVDVAPSTVKREEYGSLIGRVSFIADVPTSKSAMLAVLKDHELVERFTQEIGLPLEMHVALNPDPATHSGYAWTTGEGPPTRISVGTLCRAWVTVEEERPISLVIPHVGRESRAE